MNSLEDRIYGWLTHGHDKNGINWHDAMDTAKATLNRMPHDEFLKLISDEISDMLLYKEDAK